MHPHVARSPTSLPSPPARPPTRPAGWPARSATDVLDAVVCARSPNAECYDPASSASSDSPVAGSDPLPHRSGRGAHGREDRVEKLLEDACIKLSVVASDIFGVSGRAMMAALIAGERDPKVLAQLARSRMRTKISPARGCVQRPLRRPPRLPTHADAAPYRRYRRRHRRRRRPDRGVSGPFRLGGGTPGCDPRHRAGRRRGHPRRDRRRHGALPTAGHLCSWAKLAPGINSSAGKTKGNGSTGHGTATWPGS